MASEQNEDPDFFDEEDEIEETIEPNVSDQPQQKHISMGDIRHPIFSNTKSDFFAFFRELKAAKFKILEDVDCVLFAQMVFENKAPEQVKAMYEKKGLTFTSNCGKNIPYEHAYYMCLDCDKLRKTDSTLCCVLCKQCFVNSDHIGHRVLMAMNKDQLMTCDCGDSKTFDAKGFCGDHFHKDVSLEEISKIVGGKTMKKLQEVMSAAFYGFFALIDISMNIQRMKNASNGSHADNLRANLQKTSESLLIGILDFFSILIDNVNKAFIPLVAEFLESKLPDEYNKLNHNCKELKNIPIYTSTSQPCTCKIRDLLIKTNREMSVEGQIALTDLFSKLCNYEKFQCSLALSYMEHSYFIYYQGSPELRLFAAYSRLAELDTNIFTNQDHCTAIAKSQEMMIKSFLTMIHDVLKTYNAPNQQTSLVIDKLIMTIKRLMRPKTESCKIMLKENHIGVFLLCYLMDCNASYRYSGPIYPEIKNWEVNSFFVKFTLEIQNHIESGFKRAICQLSELDQEDQEKEYKLIMSTFKKDFQRYIKDEAAWKSTFVPAFGRTANHLMRKSDLKITQERIVEFLEEIHPGDVQRSAGLLLKNTLEQVGLLRKIYLVDNITRNTISPAYYADAYSAAETDVTSMQMLIPYLESKTCFEFLIENWFDYGPDIREYVLNKSEERQKLCKASELVLEDFLNWIVLTMIDETCLMRLMLSKDPRDYSEELDFEDDFKRVSKKALITILSCYHWADVFGVTENVKKVLWESRAASVLPEITIQDEKTDKLKLKDEFSGEMDLFLFSHRKFLVKDFFNMFQNLDPKKPNVDTISGQYYTDLPDYCYQVQKSLFESDLPQFLSRELVVEEVAENETLRPILRLILMNLQCVEFLRDVKGFDVGLIEENIRENYLNDLKFKENLDGILKNDQFKDYHLVTKKIERLLKKFHGLSEEDKANEVVDEKEINNKLSNSPDLEKKKKLAEQKMKEIKESFLNKQKAFIDNNKDLNEAPHSMTALISEKEENQKILQCNLCLHGINSKEESYGFPCYVNFVNHLSQTTFIMTEQEEESFPVLQGCEHYFHSSCFSKWRIKTFEPNSSYRPVLYQQDTYCPLCTMLSNTFCIVNKTQDKQVWDEESLLQSLANLTLYAARSGENLKVQDFGLVKNMADISQGVYSLRNMYWLFLESLNLDSFRNFSKKFKLYADFLVRIKRDVKFHNYQKAFENLRDEEPEEGEMVTLENVFIFGALCEIILSENFPKEALLEKMKAFILDKFKESFACSRIFNGGTSKDQAEFIMSALGDQSEQGVLLDEFKQLFKKILVLFALAEHQFGLAPRALQLLESLGDKNSLNLCLDYFGIKCPSDFIAEILKSESLLSAQQTKLIQGKIIGLQETAFLKSKYLLSARLEGYKFDFPATYQDFIDKYMNHPCDLCDGIPLHGEKMICLICGQVICKAYCTKKGMRLPMANGSMHALDHCGVGVYLEMFLLRLIFVNAPKNLFLKRKYLYVNESRESIVEVIYKVDDKRVDNVDFKKYKLNTDIVKYVYSMIEGFTIPLEMFNVARNNAILAADNAY